MRIFLISNMYPTTQSPGFGVFVKNVIEGLKSYNVEVACQALIRGKANNTLMKLWKYLLFYLNIFVCYWRRYDLIYIHYPNMALPVFYPLFSCCKKKVVVNLHGEDLFYSGFLGRRLGHLNEKFLKRVDLVIVPSEFFKKELLNRNICTEKKIFVSPSGGVDCKRFCPKTDVKEENGFSLGFVGRIDHNKGWREYIEALNILRPSLNFKAYVIGYGSQMEGLLSLIKLYNLSNVVEYISGVKQEELVYYYNRFDVLVFSTQLPESLGLVGLEAMACGVPVIGTAIGGVMTYLNDTNGFLVPKGDVVAISNAIRTFYNLDKKNKLELSQAALLTARKYDRCIVIKNLHDKLVELLSD